MTQRDKIRVLQVTGGMNVGGAETWLMHVLRVIDHERFQFDFLVFSNEEQAYEAEIIELGGRILRCPRPSIRPKSVLRCLQTIQRHGPYDVMHSHVNHFSGWMLAIGKACGISARMAHSHSNPILANASANRARRAYLQTMKILIRVFSTDRMAVSDEAAVALYGEKWSSDRHVRILPSAINMGLFRKEAPNPKVRHMLGIDPDTWVVGHVGRISEVKNHRFIVDVAAHLDRLSVDLQFLIVGDGALRSELESNIRSRGLGHMFIFTGVRRDVESLMLNAMNMFILPSLHEGLGLAGLEAQAAGLPCLFSTNCSSEVAVVQQLSEFLSIDDPVVWAERILEIRASPPVVTKEAALSQMLKSPFNINRGVSALEQRYAANPRQE